jgi:hypothetical protein
MFHGSAEVSDNGAYMYYAAGDPNNPAFANERTSWNWNSADILVEPNFPTYVPYAGLTKTNAIPETIGSSHKVVFTY